MGLILYSSMAGQELIFAEALLFQSCYITHLGICWTCHPGCPPCYRRMYHHASRYHSSARPSSRMDTEQQRTGMKSNDIVIVRHPVYVLVLFLPPVHLPPFLVKMDILKFYRLVTRLREEAQRRQRWLAAFMSWRRSSRLLEVGKRWPASWGQLEGGDECVACKLFETGDLKQTWKLIKTLCLTWKKSLKNTKDNWSKSDI